MKNIKALIPDYALGLLNPEQEKEVEAFLESCESCQEELKNYSTMFVAMVDSLPQLEPNSSFSKIKHSVLFDEVKLDNTGASETISETPIDSKPIQNTDFLSSLRQLFTTWRYQSLSAALACSLAILSFLGWGQYQNYLDSNQTQALVTQWLSSDSTTVMPFTSEAGENLGSLIADKASETALVILEKPPAENRVYQAWGEVDKTCLPLALSESNIFEISWQDKDVNAIVVSSEPPGGSEQSTEVVSKVEFF